MDEILRQMRELKEQNLFPTQVIMNQYTLDDIRNQLDIPMFSFERSNSPNTIYGLEILILPTARGVKVY